MQHNLTIAAFAALAAVAGCGSDAPQLPEYGICGEIYKDLPVEINRDIDILFVIDNAPSMAEEQASLVTNFNRFINVLENIEGGLPNVHIGVISSDLGAGPYTFGNCEPGGDGGRLQSSPQGDCAPPQQPFISDIANYDGTRTRNYTGDLADAFACIATLGTDGCEFSQPLEAARLALEGSVSLNEGFLREDAFLAVVLITDQDDCSVEAPSLFDPAATELGPLSTFRCFEHGVVCDPDTPRVPGPRTGCRPRADSMYSASVDEYAEFLHGIKDDPNMVVVAAIIGNHEPVVVATDGDGNPALSPSCESASGSAIPGVRLRHFADLFPQRNTLTSVCNEDLSDVLVIIAILQAHTIGAPCVEGEIDLDPEMPGLQYECTVSEVRYPGEDRQEETLVRECELLPPEPGTFPCWAFEVDANICPDTATHSLFRVYHGAASVPTGTHSILRCSTGCSEL